MPIERDAIFEQTLRCLSAHLHPEWGDRDALDTFNRLLAKHVKPNRWTPNTHLAIQRDQVRSRREQWTTDDLGKLAPGHPDPRGHDFDCPIIVAEFEGALRLLDGNHRINRWMARRDLRPHDVNIHTIIGPYDFHELPARRANQ